MIPQQSLWKSLKTLFFQKMSRHAKYKNKTGSKQEKQKFGVLEPERTTLYDILKTNFKIANRVSNKNEYFT